MMNPRGTRLYYSTETVSGEVLELISVQMESQRRDFACADANNMAVFPAPAAGKLVFGVRGYAITELVNLFYTATLTNWLIEMPVGMPGGMSWMFKGYVETIDRTLTEAKLTIRIVGEVTGYYDSPVPQPKDTTDVFSRKASRAQAKVLSSVLSSVTALGSARAARDEWNATVAKILKVPGRA